MLTATADETARSWKPSCPIFDVLRPCRHLLTLAFLESTFLSDIEPRLCCCGAQQHIYFKHTATAVPLSVLTTRTVLLGQYASQLTIQALLFMTFGCHDRVQPQETFVTGDDIAAFHVMLALLVLQYYWLGSGTTFDTGTACSGHCASKGS